MTENLDRDLRRRVARAELSRRAFIVGLVFVTACVVGALLALTVAIRQTQTDGTPTGRRIVALQETITDCVTPTGECYKRAQKRTGDAIATLNLATLYAVYCVDRNPHADIPSIQACVRDLYANGDE